jgi:hypothetical protein
MCLGAVLLVCWPITLLLLFGSRYSQMPLPAAQGTARSNTTNTIECLTFILLPSTVSCYSLQQAALQAVPQKAGAEATGV